MSGAQLRSMGLPCFAMGRSTTHASQTSSLSSLIDAFQIWAYMTIATLLYSLQHLCNEAGSAALQGASKTPSSLTKGEDVVILTSRTYSFDTALICLS